MKQIAEAIIAVMKDIEGVAKNMQIGTGSSAYKGVSDKDVRQQMRESMIEHGLSILPIGVNAKIQVDRWEEESIYQGKSQGMKTKQSCFTEVETKYLLLHTSGESIEVSGYGHGVDTQDKGAGKATTYALKNTLLNMFLVPTGVDTDDTHSDDIPVPKSKPKPKQQEQESEESVYNRYKEKFSKAETLEELKQIWTEAQKLGFNKEYTDLLIAIKDEKKLSITNSTTTNE